MRAIVSSSVSILVLLPLCFKTSNTLLSMYPFCNSRTNVISFYSGHVCDALCVNASVLITHKHPG
jgi:hypothetical protein